MSKAIKPKKVISQSKKITMKSTMPSLLEEDQDGNLLRSIEIFSQNNSKKRKLEERLRLLPPLLKRAKREKVKKEKLKKEEVTLREKLKRRKKKRRKPLSRAMVSQQTLSLSQLLTSLITTNNKISKEN